MCALRKAFFGFLSLVMLLSGMPAVAMDIVKDGNAAAVIVANKDDKPGQQAAGVLADWIAKMTDVRLTVTDTVPGGMSAIYVGRRAITEGLKLDDIASPSHEGLRIICDGRRLLLAGQDDTSTVKAACRLLEEFGCRFLLDHPLGMVFPRTKNLSAGAINISEKPGLLYRTIWGSSWGGQLWKTWNGAGGLSLNMGHAWGGYIPKEEFTRHPEWFALINGQRVKGDWYCTSNPELREAFAQGVMRAIEGGNLNPSISPPDGRSYCQCPACKAQDDPNSVEPSSGTVNITNRYLDFYQDVAKRVAAKYPKAILNFYCYADYTQPPTSGIKLASNLCAWVAPIRYCRLHRTGQPGCESREQLVGMLGGWSDCATKMGYRTYNFNLAECLVPVSLVSVWSHDIPYLRNQGCIGFNLESLRNWQIYGPHMYLSIRLAYNPDADPKAIMDDYFQRMYGPKAGPLVQQYWQRIDDAFVNLKSHAGGYYNLQLVYTPEFIAKLQGLLDQATAAVKDDPVLVARVQIFAEGLANARQYGEMCAALNAGNPVEAARVYDDLLARSQRNAKNGLGQEYTVTYLERFIAPQIRMAAAAAQQPNRLLAVMPETMRLAYDEGNKGVELGYAKPDYDDTKWLSVHTSTMPLDAQGLADRRTIQWFRCTFDVKPQGKKLALLVLEVDGGATIYVNGKEVGANPKKRKPFEVEITDAVNAGTNSLAIRVDHSIITELFLGGILRPVYLIEKDQ
ncbi:MAG: DUF4838 domain-containing protein [Armatimonadota bacterium]